MVRMVENPRWPPILKITLISTFFLKNGSVYLAEILYGVLVGLRCSVVLK